MEADERKTTVPSPPVDADGEQPNSKNYSDIITDCAVESNEKDAALRECLRKLEHMQNPAYLQTFSMSDLYETVFESRPSIIDGLLYRGAYLFVGAPKVGKSFFMAQLAYHVSMGISLWDYPVRKSTVLYLALEDTEKRLKNRLFRMYGTECSEHLHFVIFSKKLGAGLKEQLNYFMQHYPDTGLIIVDTLQKVRDAGGDSYSYGNDYDIVGQFKQFADEHKICILIVHHTRKQQAEDKFDMISGTNGLLGASDGVLLLQKEKRTSNAATLDISGRDQQDQRLHLTRDMEHLTWVLEKVETELWKEPPDPILEAVATLVTQEQPTWRGTATELVCLLQLDMNANMLTRHLNVKAERLLDVYGIQYKSNRSHTGRCITLTLLAQA